MPDLKITSMRIKKKPGRPPRSAEQERQLKNLIIDTARQLFAEDGFESVSIRNIAAQAGIAPMTIYRFFANKRALLYYIWDDIFEIQDHFCQIAVDEQQTTIDKLTTLIRSHITFWLEHPAYFKVIFFYQDQPSADTGQYYVDRDNQQQRLSMVTSLLQQGVDEGAFKRHDILAQAHWIYTQVLGIALTYITIPEFDWIDSSVLTETAVEGIIGRISIP